MLARTAHSNNNITTIFTKNKWLAVNFGLGVCDVEQTSKHLQLSLAAEAARASLAELEQEYVHLSHRMADMAESMHMLQGVIDAWERLDPARDSLAKQLARIDHELRGVACLHETAANGAVHYTDARVRPLSTDAPPRPRGADAWPARGEILERVHRVLSNGRPLSPSEVHAAIDQRYQTAYSINAVSMAMRHGAESGKYQYNGQTGKYRVVG